MQDEAESEEEAKDFAMQELCDQLCRGDYYEPTDCDCDCEIEELDGEET